MQLRGADKSGEGQARGAGTMVHSQTHWGRVSPEVQDRVGNGRGSVVKGFNDDGETYGEIPWVPVVTTPSHLFLIPHPNIERNQPPAAQT